MISSTFWSYLVQVAKFVTDFAKDVTFSPGLNMFGLYALKSSGWPQQPTPIGFSNPDIDAVIVNPLYDERTGMKNAQARPRPKPVIFNAYAYSMVCLIFADLLVRAVSTGVPAQLSKEQPSDGSRGWTLRGPQSWPWGFHDDGWLPVLWSQAGQWRSGWQLCEAGFHERSGITNEIDSQIVTM